MKAFDLATRIGMVLGLGLGAAAVMALAWVMWQYKWYVILGAIFLSLVVVGYNQLHRSVYGTDSRLWKWLERQ